MSLSPPDAAANGLARDILFLGVFPSPEGEALLFSLLPYVKRSKAFPGDVGADIRRCLLSRCRLFGLWFMLDMGRTREETEVGGVVERSSEE